MKLIIFAVLFLIPAGIFGQNTDSVAFPDSIPGKRGAAFMEFLNSNDDRAVLKFVQDQMQVTAEPFEERVSSFKRTRDFLGGSILRGVVSVGATKISFIIETKRKSFARVLLELNPEAESRITEIGVERVDENILNENSDRIMLTEEQLIPEVKKYFNLLSQNGEFSGTVLIARDGRTIFSNAYGLADRDAKTPNKSDTKFNIGSINKIFTILAIGMLADEGKLSFADLLGKHLPDYPNKEAREKITIEQLLTMRSGIGDIFGPNYDATPKSKLRSIKDYLPLFATEPLAFAPGTDQQYSNGGFLVLGAIIEKISGKTYYDFVRERIFKPNGMLDTDSFESDAKTENLALGYKFSEETKSFVSNISTLPARGSSAGGGYSTVSDLLKFSNALESGAFPTPKSLNSVRDPILNGLAQGGLRFAGGAPGINALILNKTGGTYTIIVLSNLDPPSASKPGQQIRSWIESIKPD